jgi:transcriptional regulator with XRE-family HTH domain
MLEIGKRIKALRQKKGWSQVEAAELLKISVPAFSKIETDVTDVNVSRLSQIADLFEVHISKMFLDEHQDDPESLSELKKAKDTIETQAAKISHLQEYIITLYEELHKLKTVINH